MATHSIFEFGDQFGISSPFGDWLGTPEKKLSIRIQAVYRYVDANKRDKYRVVYLITAAKLEAFAGTVNLVQEGIVNVGLLNDEYPTNSVTLRNGTTTAQTDFFRARVERNQNRLEGEPTFFLRLTCDGVTVESSEFDLTNAKELPAQAQPQAQHNPIDCAFDSELTVEQLLWLAGGYLPVNQRPQNFPTEANIRKHLDNINWVLKRYDISGPLKRMHFLTQVLHETVGLSATTEFSGKMGKWRGRGLLQITGEGTYKEYGDYVRNRSKEGSAVPIKNTKFHPETSPKDLDAVAQEPHAAWSAGWFWAVKNGKNYYNGIASSNDLLQVAVELNGGFNGFDDREKRLQTALNSLPDNCPAKKIPILTFIESHIYGSRLQSFAWALWHDEGIQDAERSTCRNDREEARAGYQRALDLEKQAKNETRLTSQYGVLDIPLFKPLQHEDKGTKYLLLQEVAESRLKAL